MMRNEVAWAAVLCISLLVLFLAGCHFSDTQDVQIKQPGKPNVLQYASPAEIDQWSHKVANSILKHGVPGYTLLENGNVELVVQFDKKIVRDYAAVLVQKYGGKLSDKQESDETVRIMIPQQEFWRFVKDDKVEKVGILPPPNSILSQMS